MPQPDYNHQYHQEAAKHHEQAAKSHLEAAKLQELGKHEASATHALTAHGHALHALHHSNEAIKQHAEKQAPVAPAKKV